MSDFLLFLEILGTISFAVSGAIKAIHKKMDVLGVCILGLITAVGGGILRDLILGNTPPSSFVNPRPCIIAVSTSIVIFLPFVRKFLSLHKRGYELCLLITDTIGLAVFSVIGVRLAWAGFNNNLFLLVFVGVITGVGGGMIRDILANSVPDIFVKYFYASASIIGVIVCSLLYNPLGETLAMIIGMIIIVLLRFLAAKFRWKLPVSIDNDPNL